MVNTLDKIRRDERGMTLVLSGLGLMAFMAASVLAVDVGMLMTARNQAQNAADAGALAAATTLAFNDYNNRSASGPAVQNAITAATNSANGVMSQPVSVTPADVTFLNDPNGQPNWVRIKVYRTGDHAN